jgi:hypothetical protein
MKKNEHSRLQGVILFNFHPLKINHYQMKEEIDIPIVEGKGDV